MWDLGFLSGSEVARLVRRRQLSAVEIAGAALERIRALNGRLEAFTTVMEEQALESAGAADRALVRGEPLGPLHGVPIALKDNFETAGVRTTAGSRVLEDHVPGRDATTVQRLRAAGAVVVGKTLLSEFAIGPTVLGEMRNPWDPARLAGASSGGSGAAVAAGMCPIAMGSDTGGSIRIPASFSGVVGLKPTYGLVSRAGVVPLAWSLDCAGPITRTVEDAALALSVIAGHDPRDPVSSREAVPNYRRGLRAGVQGLRVGLPKEWFFDLVDPEVRRAVLRAVGVLKGIGASTHRASMPLVTRCLEIGPMVLWAEAAAYHEEDLERSADRYGPVLLKLLRAAKLINAADYLRAQRLRRVLRGQFLAALSKVDVLITPTTPTTAPLLSQRQYTVAGQRVSRTYAIAAFTFPVNQAGLPAISIPCGFTRTGLPIGMQVIGRPFDEATLLRAAHAYERETDWHERRPAL